MAGISGGIPAWNTENNNVRMSGWITEEIFGHIYVGDFNGFPWAIHEQISESLPEWISGWIPEIFL